MQFQPHAYMSQNFFVLCFCADDDAPWLPPDEWQENLVGFRAPRRCLPKATIQRVAFRHCLYAAVSLAHGATELKALSATAPHLTTAVDRVADELIRCSGGYGRSRSGGAGTGKEQGQHNQ